MRISYLAAGAGLTYCGACVRDLALVAGLRSGGHDVDLIALYTPLKGDAEGVAETARMYFGGINVFLQHVSPVFRHTPAGFDNLLDYKPLLGLAGRFAVRTAPESLGSLTVSVLAGQDGNQRKEFAKLLDHYRRTARPDVVNITNSLLVGIAPVLKRRLGVPIVCNVQGEDSFLERIPEPYLSRCRELMLSNARHVDLFLAPSRAHALKMAGILGVPADEIRIVRAGIDATPYARTAARIRAPFTVGYLSVIGPTKGLDVLVEAVGTLVSERGRDVRLRVAGRVGDPAYWAGVQQSIRERGLASRTEYAGELILKDKVAFLHALGAFCVPSRIEESRGMAVLEAMAASLPVVAVASGVFPELMGDGAYGLLSPPGDAAALADALSRLMDDPDGADRLGRAAAGRIAERHTLARMVEGIERAYREAGAVG